MSDTQPPKCNSNIYKNGVCVAMLTGATANVIECFIKEIARATGEPVDWHYVGGRARVLTTGDQEKVRKEIDMLRLTVNLYDNGFVKGMFG